MKEKYNKFLNTINSLVIIGSASTSISLSITGFGLFVVPITAGVASGVANSSKWAGEILKKRQIVF